MNKTDDLTREVESLCALIDACEEGRLKAFLLLRLILAMEELRRGG
ncbi:MAG: hypothetical protein H6573_34685 [Lewinellaceae bacterium]|nr:hypothetical protein [Lewinellaceae bacterium]